MIKNKTKNLVLAKKTKHCKMILEKAIGLMFSKKIKDKGLVFHFKKEQQVSLHMFFVFFPIDVLYLNKNKEVIYKKENFKPWTTLNPKVKPKYIIELPTGTIKKTKIKDKIIF